MLGLMTEYHKELLVELLQLQKALHHHLEQLEHIQLPLLEEMITLQVAMVTSPVALVVGICKHSKVVEADSQVQMQRATLAVNLVNTVNNH